LPFVSMRRGTWPERRLPAEYRGIMRRLICVLCLAPLSACLQIGLPGDSSGGGAASGGAASAGSAGASSDAGTATVTGVDCGVDPSSGVALCLGITSCPTVLVDSDQMPGCGYRISGSTIDLECLCNDSLCPVGAAATCADAKALLADQTSQGVCASIAEGRCTAVSQAATPTPSTSSSCNTDCRDNCAGDPGCITLCGC
jgi:hypothetical protein